MRSKPSDGFSDRSISNVSFFDPSVLARGADDGFGCHLYLGR
jgi:hypothetical protein